MTVKKIHIEKYDIETFEKEKKPYVMICTDVIQRIRMKYSQAFLLWVFLESLPPTWKPNRYHLMENFEISERTYERHMRWLNAVGLIEYRQCREKKGAFGKGHLVVLNGTKFNPEAEIHGTVKIGGTVINKKKPKVIHNLSEHRTAKFGDSAETPETRSSPGLNKNSPNRQITEPRLDAVHINTTVKTNKEYKKTNNTISVFSDTESVKTHLKHVIVNRKLFVEDDIIDQIVFYVGSERNYDEVVKKLNIALKLVRDGKWNVPQNYNGISSQSIRKNEKVAEKSNQVKHQQEAKIFQGITEAITKGEGLQGFRSFLNQLKDDVNDTTSKDRRAMQAHAV